MKQQLNDTLVYKAPAFRLTSLLGDRNTLQTISQQQSRLGEQLQFYDNDLNVDDISSDFN